MLGYPIRKEIREKLQSLKSILSRTSETSKKVYSPRDKESKKSYQENISKTPYIIMASHQQFEADWYGSVSGLTLHITFLLASNVSLICFLITVLDGIILPVH